MRDERRGGAAKGTVAEADGNRTRQAEILGFTGFEDREGHQAPVRLHGPLTYARHHETRRRVGPQ